MRAPLAPVDCLFLEPAEPAGERPRARCCGAGAAPNKIEQTAELPHGTSPRSTLFALLCRRAARGRRKGMNVRHVELFGEGEGHTNGRRGACGPNRGPPAPPLPSGGSSLRRCAIRPRECRREIDCGLGRRPQRVTAPGCEATSGLAETPADSVTGGSPPARVCTAQGPNGDGVCSVMDGAWRRRAHRETRLRRGRRGPPCLVCARQGPAGTRAGHARRSHGTRARRALALLRPRATGSQRSRGAAAGRTGKASRSRAPRFLRGKRLRACGCALLGRRRLAGTGSRTRVEDGFCTSWEACACTARKKKLGGLGCFGRATWVKTGPVLYLFWLRQHCVRPGGAAGYLGSYARLCS